MSTSSSSVSGTVVAAHLLGGIAAECSAIGSEIAQLGAAVSGSAGQRGAGMNVVRMQSFDRLMQNAHAQACLLAHIARLLLSGSATDRESLLLAIDGVPLPETRERLRRAVGIERTEYTVTDDEFWSGDDLPVTIARRK